MDESATDEAPILAAWWVVSGRGQRKVTSTKVVRTSCSRLGSI